MTSSAGPGQALSVAASSAASACVTADRGCATRTVARTNFESICSTSGPEGIDVEQMLSKFVRATVRVAHPRSAVTQALAALDAATDSACPGPALLVIPIQHAAAIAERPRIVRSRPL